MSIKNINKVISVLTQAYPMIDPEQHILRTPTGLSFAIPVHTSTDQLKDYLREHLQSMDNTFLSLGFVILLTPEDLTPSNYVGGTINTNTK